MFYSTIRSTIRKLNAPIYNLSKFLIIFRFLLVSYMYNNYN